MNNLKIREFQQAIVDFSNKSDLPTEVKRLCLEEILVKLRDSANQQLMVEIQQRDSAEKEHAKEENDGKTV